MVIRAGTMGIRANPVENHIYAYKIRTGTTMRQEQTSNMVYMRMIRAENEMRLIKHAYERFGQSLHEHEQIILRIIYMHINQSLE